MYTKYLKNKFNALSSDIKFKEIFRGSVWAISARVVGLLVGIVFSVSVARIYGAETMGVLAVLNAFFVLVNIFTVMGTSTSILRLIPEHLTKFSPTSAFKVYCKTQYLVICASILTSGISFFLANFIADKIFSKPHLAYYFALSSCFVLFRSIMLLNTNAIRGLSHIKLFALMQIMPQILNLFFLVVLGYFGGSNDIPVYSLLLGFAATGTISSGFIQVAFRKKLDNSDIVKSITIQEILSISFPMLMTATMMFLITQTGVLMLSMFRSEAEVGYYSIAVKLATLTTFMLQAVTSMAAPKFSELFHSGKMDELFHVAKKSTKLIFFSTIPILMCFLFFGKLIIEIFYGKSFVVANLALIFLVIGQFVNSVAGSTGTFMNMTGNQKVFKNIMLVAALLNIGLNIWLIPMFGINGAAVSAMTSLCFWNITTLIYMKIKFGKTTAYFPFL